MAGIGPVAPMEPLLVHGADDNITADEVDVPWTHRARTAALAAAVSITIGALLATSGIVGGGGGSALPAEQASAAARDAGPTMPYTSRTNDAGLLVTEAGCLDDLSAASLDEKFRGRVGPLLGVDNQHVIELGRGRRLWLFHDGFADYTGTSNELGREFAAYLHSVAFVETGGCFDIVHGGTQEEPEPFEQGDTFDTELRFYWPLGGEIGAGGKLYVFWAKMQQDDKPGPLNGIRRHPVETWIGVYDPATLERLEFRRAPNPGVQPQYGFAVQSQGRWSYLFGNSNQLNLEIEGGYDNGPFSATRMYLARVPRGRFLAAPEYYTGSGWSPTAEMARPISERFYNENTMQPRLIDGRWVAVTKQDGFLSDTFVFDVAEHPWGPWTTVSTREVPPRDGPIQVSYQPILMPWRDADGSLIVMVSQNAAHWPDAVAHPPHYRPMVFDEPWPEAR